MQCKFYIYTPSSAELINMYENSISGRNSSFISCNHAKQNKNIFVKDIICKNKNITKHSDYMLKVNYIKNSCKHEGLI